MLTSRYLRWVVSAQDAMVSGVVVQAYPIVDVTDWPVANIEPRGGGVNVWLGRAADLWLFKPVSRKSWGFQAEDRAEKISAEIAGLIRVPCAQVELAEREGVRGVISRDLAPSPWELQTGSLLLAGEIDGYQVGAKNIRGRPGHSLLNIRASLRDLGVPVVDSSFNDVGAFDLFCGYLVLDALVANRDRHDENWAVLRPTGRTARDLLCPSFDHGSALGFNLTETKMGLYLRERRQVVG